jgi:osmotically-inducible protein OsmY
MSRPRRRSSIACASLLLATLPFGGPLLAQAGGTTGHGVPPATADPPKPPVGGPRNIGGPGDFGLREKLIKRMARDPDLASSRLVVVLVNGGVVLSGTVPNWSARRRALIMAGTMRGVVNVTDQMEIERGAIKDGAILEAMASLLKDQREHLELKELDISVGDGVATLSGTVRDFAARVRAEEVVGTVLGATRVINRLRPANAPAGTDDLTTRKAVASYLRDFREFPYPGEITVDVSGGQARLTGSVSVYLGRQQAGTMVALVGGVREVDNRILVDPSLSADQTTVTEAK